MLKALLPTMLLLSFVIDARAEVCPPNCPRKVTRQDLPRGLGGGFGASGGYVGPSTSGGGGYSGGGPAGGGSGGYGGGGYGGYRGGPAGGGGYGGYEGGGYGGYGGGGYGYCITDYGTCGARQPVGSYCTCMDGAGYVYQGMVQ